MLGGVAVSDSMQVWNISVSLLQIVPVDSATMLSIAAGRGPLVCMAKGGSSSKGGEVLPRLLRAPAPLASLARATPAAACSQLMQREGPRAAAVKAAPSSHTIRNACCSPWPRAPQSAAAKNEAAAGEGSSAGGEAE